jgi:transcriptional regulator with XRE-family HTH domain
MKHEQLQPKEVAKIKHGYDPSQITYEDLLSHVRERRWVELEKGHPGRASNTNAVSNTTRALTAFMEANDLSEMDVVSEELIGTSLWDIAIRVMGTDSTARRRRGEINTRIRPWAMELIRAASAIFEDETFGQRLKRLREEADLTLLQLARAISKGNKKTTEVTLFTWEKEEKRPAPSSLYKVERMEEVLGVPPGYLSEIMPATPYFAKSHETGLSRSVQRRVSAHLPDDFDSRDIDEQDRILEWVAENILSTPKEVLEDGSTSAPKVGPNLSVYALSREPSARLKMAPKHLLNELDALRNFKTADFVPLGLNRNLTWSSSIADRQDYEVRAFFGALYQMGLPEANMSLSTFLCPGVIDRFIAWKRERRGGYTRSIEITLELIDSSLHPKFGLIAQSPGFGARLPSVGGLISEADVQRAQGDWVKACEYAKAFTSKRLKELTNLVAKGRDPFEALLPVLDHPQPLREYYKIVHEIRDRMPGDVYPLRRAEALRDLMILRLGLDLALRQKNNRELFVCLPGQIPRSWKELKRLARGEMSLNNEGGWIVRMPKSAFKNSDSNAVDEENTFPLKDRDGLYGEIEEYLDARPRLLKTYEDPGTFFVKTVSGRTKTAAYDQFGYYNAFRKVVRTYGIYNPFTGRGAIRGLRPHGPHSVRHVLATHLVATTGGFSEAAGLLLDSEQMVRETYAKWGSEDRHTRSRDCAWDSIFNEGGDA